MTAIHKKASRSGTKKQQKTVKAFDEDIEFINEQAKARGCTAAEVIRALCQRVRKEIYRQEVAETFDAIASDPYFEAESKLWEATLADGLDDAY
jgi:hypothetical protein